MTSLAGHTLLTLDAETYFDDIYNLKKMTGLEYVTDRRFKLQCVCVAVNGDDPIDVPVDELAEFLHAIPRPVALLAQNTQFDGLILSYHHRFVADYYLDTKSMSQGLWPHESSSLKPLAERLWPDDPSMRKGDELELSRGVLDWSEELHETMVGYCKQDVRLTRAAFFALFDHGFPRPELDIIHQMTRWCVDPVLELDIDLVQRYIPMLEAERKQIIVNSGLWRFAQKYNLDSKQRPQFEKEFATELRAGRVTADDHAYWTSLKVLNSNKAFSQWMTSNGVVPATKVNPQGKTTLALAKNDPEFMAIMEQFPQHANVWVARASAKSTQALSRAHRFIDTAIAFNGKMPTPVNYGAALTGRAAGAEKLGMMNIQRNAKPNHPLGDLRPGVLRRALMAPPSYVVIVGDLSNIEARLLAYLADHHVLLAIFADNGDPYAWQAESIFHRKISKKENPFERDVGKVTVLSLGYGAGHVRFKRMLNSGPMGMAPIFFEDPNMYRLIVDTYRRDNAPVVRLWGLADTFIEMMTHEDCDFQWKMLRFQHNRVILPSGLSLQYPNLRASPDGWIYDTREGVSGLYGAHLIENICQALANCVIKEAMRRTETALIPLGGRTALQVHDEVVSIALRRWAEEAVAAQLAAMTVVPDWAPGLPIAAEVGWAGNYVK